MLLLRCVWKSTQILKRTTCYSCSLESYKLDYNRKQSRLFLYNVCYVHSKHYGLKMILISRLWHFFGHGDENSVGSLDRRLIRTYSGKSCSLFFANQANNTVGIERLIDRWLPAEHHSLISAFYIAYICIFYINRIKRSILLKFLLYTFHEW